MEASMEHLLALIDDIYKYVDDVVVWCVAFFTILLSGIVLIHFHLRKGESHQTTKLGNLFQMP
jgi:hypothetical protein